MGTDQFWRVLSTLAGDCDFEDGVGAVDVLAEGSKIKDAFQHVVSGPKSVVGKKVMMTLFFHGYKIRFTS